MFSSVQSLSCVQLFVTPWTAAHQSSLSITNSRSLLKLRSIKLVISSNHLILCHLLLLPSIFLSIKVFSNESVLHIRWPEYWSFSFSISPYFLWDWLVWSPYSPRDSQESSPTPQFKSTNFSVFSFLYSQALTSTWLLEKTRQTVVGKVMSLLFNMLSRLVIAFLPRSRHLLISWLQLPSTVVLEHPQNKVCHCFRCFPIYLPWSDGTGCQDLSFLSVAF